MMQVTSNRDVIAAFKVKWLFLAIDLEIRCNLFTAKCENYAFENSDTFDGWLCEFLFCFKNHSVLKNYQLLTELLQYYRKQL